MPTGRSVRPAPPRAGEAGYTLAVLIGILTVLAIALAAAMPHWVARAQREKEAELVARGLQYAEAIRVFQRRFGRLPNTLEELVELEPRSIRRLWRNPFAAGDDGGWATLMEVAGGQTVAIDPATGALVAPPPGGRGEDGGAAGAEEQAARDAFPPAAPAATAASAPGAAVAGPIHGVKSRLRGEAYLRYFGQKDYGDWEFSVEQLVAATSATTPEGLLRRADYALIGRAFPYSPPGAGGSPPAPAPEAAPGATPPARPPRDEAGEDEG